MMQRRSQVSVVRIAPPLGAERRTDARVSAMSPGKLEGARRGGADSSDARWRWRVDRAWGGERLAAEEIAEVSLVCNQGVAEIRVDAPYAGDPAPQSPAGRCDGLWNYEVVELFVCGDDQRYLEVECGPHGHYLALLLHGPRVRVCDDVPVTRYAATIQGARWRGVLALEQRWLPPGMASANAYRITGHGSVRAYAAASPGHGPPDFHRLELFQPLSAATATD
jgi:hypothetical protein